MLHGHATTGKTMPHAESGSHQTSADLPLGPPAEPPSGPSDGPSDGPTAEPPAGADPLLWRLAYGLHRDHRAQPDGSCVTCRQAWPCAPRGLADRGLSAALIPPEARR